MAFQMVTAALKTAFEGQAYSEQVLAIEPTGAITYSIVSGALPSGVTLTPATGVVSGTPAAGTVGTYTVKFDADDGATTVQTGNLTFSVLPAAYNRAAEFLLQNKVQVGADHVYGSGVDRVDLERHFFDLPSDKTYVHDAIRILMQSVAGYPATDRSVDQVARDLNTAITAISGKVFAETTAALVDGNTAALTDIGGNQATFQMTGAIYFGKSGSADAATSRSYVRITDPTTEDEYTDDDGNELVIASIYDDQAVPVEINPDLNGATQVDSDGFYVGTTVTVTVGFSAGSTNPKTYIAAQPDTNLVVNYGLKKTFQTLTEAALFRKANITGEVDADIKQYIAEIKGDDYFATPAIDLVTAAAAIAASAKFLVIGPSGHYADFDTALAAILADTTTYPAGSYIFMTLPPGVTQYLSADRTIDRDLSITAVSVAPITGSASTYIAKDGTANPYRILVSGGNLYLDLRNVGLRCQDTAPDANKELIYVSGANDCYVHFQDFNGGGQCLWSEHNAATAVIRQDVAGTGTIRCTVTDGCLMSIVAPATYVIDVAAGGLAFIAVYGDGDWEDGALNGAPGAIGSIAQYTVIPTKTTPSVSGGMTRLPTRPPHMSVPARSSDPTPSAVPADDNGMMWYNTASHLIRACINSVFVSMMSNPMTTQGDIITGAASGVPQRLALGTQNYVLAAGATDPQWMNLVPITTQGDIIYGNATPVPARLPIGSTDQVLTVSGGQPAWAAATPLTTAGDIIRGDTASGDPERLALGAAGTVLTSVGGQAAWAVPGSGTWTINNTQVIHVSENGNDGTGDGSPYKPYLTVSKALTVLAASGPTAIMVHGDITETAALDLSGYSDLAIIGDGQGVSRILNATTNTTMIVLPTAAKSNIAIMNIMLENTDDDPASQALRVGTSGAAGSLTNLIIHNVHCKARGGQDGIVRLWVDNASGSWASSSITNLSIEWGTIPTAPAVTTGLDLTDLLDASASILIDGLQFVNLGWSGAHSVDAYAVEVMNSTVYSKVIINNMQMDVAPIGTGQRVGVKGTGASTVTVQNSKIRIDAGNDITGNVYGMLYCLALNNDVTIYREFDAAPGSSSTTAGIGALLSGSTGNVGRVILHTTGTWTLAELTVGYFCSALNQHYGENTGILLLGGDGGDTLTANADYGIGGVYVLGSSQPSYHATLTGVLDTVRSTGAGIATFTNFQATHIRAISGATHIGHLVSVMLDTDAANTALTTCAALALGKATLANTVIIGSGVLAFVDRGATSAAYAGPAVVHRPETGFGGNPSLVRPANNLAYSKFTSATDATVAAGLSTTNMGTV